jgi:general secretion pathway protein I
MNGNAHLCKASNFHPRARSRARGFTLLEVLTAFVILALVGTALFGVFGGSLRNASAADDWSRGLLVAQSRLALAASARTLKESSEQGTDTDPRYQWRTTVVPYTPPDANPDIEHLSETMPDRLYKISVDVSFAGPAGGERVISLSTLKLAQRNP